MFLARSSERAKVEARLLQTEHAVWPSAHLVCVMVILSIIFPKAHFADFVASAPVKGLVPAAWATEGLLVLLWFRDIFKHW
jgi:hypothetical protein